MPVINFLTPCIFDSGALKQLEVTAKKLGITRAFIVTDPGIKAAGILDKVVAALGTAPAGIFAETVANVTPITIIPGSLDKKTREY